MIVRGLAASRIAQQAAPCIRRFASSHVQQAHAKRRPASAPRGTKLRASGGAVAAMVMPKDYTTQSNYAEVKEVARHYELDVDFDRNVIEGYAKVRRAAGRFR